VGVIGAADGPLGTGRSQYHLRQNLQGLEAITMPKPEFFAGSISTKTNAEGDLTDADSRERLKAWLHAFVEWVEKKV
jgi:chromate reductase, NAD(P)H dehydrogenase (quinone)